MNASPNPKSEKTVQISQILGVLLLVGDPDFFKGSTRENALNTAINLYRQWNTNWSGAGKFPVEVSFTSYRVAVNATGIAELCTFAGKSSFAANFGNHSLFIQPLVLSTAGQAGQQGQPVEACLVTFVQIPPEARKALVIVQGSLDFVA